jgi:YD repeat-containing protein
MTQRTMNGVLYEQAFDGENRLTSVTVGGQTTSFAYDADGNRLLTVLPNGTKVYTPFPDYEETAPTSGATTQRTTYSLAGQFIGMRVRTGATSNGAVYYAYTDHLGNVVAWTNAGGVMVGNSLARYERKRDGPKPPASSTASQPTLSYATPTYRPAASAPAAGSGWRSAGRRPRPSPG